MKEILNTGISMSRQSLILSQLVDKAFIIFHLKAPLLRLIASSDTIKTNLEYTVLSI
jgi:hypothetical protein